MLNLANLLTPDREMLDPVFNTEKNICQLVLAKIPMNKKVKLGLPKMKKAYFCTEPGKTNWTIEFAENLRTATIFEQK